ncbi:MAG TPA: DUF4331 family protein [Pyrinomonadaceae bacterium]|nr:DUF4331 family protein [Pyrinomonadaceae bacterium]
MHFIRKAGLIVGLLLLVIAATLAPVNRLEAADHGDAPFTAHDLGADLNDVYMFLDPTDNSKLILIMTVHGFIVPGENSNFGIFDPALRYRFELDTNGDAKPDGDIDVRFSQRVSVGGSPQAQVATINLPNGRTFTAPSTNSSNTADVAPTPVITTDPQSGVSFFAGLTDDPFFFDIPAFGRFNASIRAGAANPSVFSRGRDTFAGYNTMAIALSLPLSLIRGPANQLGVIIETQRRTPQFYNSRTGEVASSGRWTNIDRMGNPAVNVVLIPFNQKNMHNASSPVEDANRRFWPGILDTLQNFYKTDATSIAVFENLLVKRGDYLRLDLTIPNTGTNTEAQFPNGRRLTDDVVDILNFLINNRQPLPDNANGNDIPLRTSFPFLAPSHQPRVPGTIDDSTRN